MSLEDDFYRFRAGWTKLGIWGLSENQWGALSEYGRLLHLWSGKMNLISRLDREQIATRHTSRGLVLVKIIEPMSPQTIIDVGSGAGIPAIPIKVCLPGVEMFLVESRRRRASFLRFVVRELGLKNIHVVNERIENWDSGVKADVFTARAVARPDDLRNWMGSHAALGATLVSTLNKDVTEEKIQGTEIHHFAWLDQSMRVGLFPINYQH